MKEVEVEIKGSEKIAFTRFWTEMHTEGEGEEATTTITEHNNREKKSTKFIDFKKKVYDVPGDML